MRKALICGVSGQDGAYLAQFLLDKGYRVFGTSRTASPEVLSNLRKLGVVDQITVIPLNMEDAKATRRTLSEIAPDELYNLAGQSSVGRSYHEPSATFSSIASSTLNILEGIRSEGLALRMFNAGSGEMFGDAGNVILNESSPIAPSSPYAMAKAAAFWAVKCYRETYGVFASTGILFNHESPLRPNNFVTRKVADAVRRIAAGEQDKLRLGNLAVVRDWGWAPEYVEAMWLMLQQDEAEDLVLATGESHSLENFVGEMFAAGGLDWTEHVIVEDSLFRPGEPLVERANPEKAAMRLGWRAQTKFAELAKKLVEDAR